MRRATKLWNTPPFSLRLGNKFHWETFFRQIKQYSAPSLFTKLDFMFPSYFYFYVSIFSKINYQFFISKVLFVDEPSVYNILIVKTVIATCYWWTKLYYLLVRNYIQLQDSSDCWTIEVPTEWLKYNIMLYLSTSQYSLDYDYRVKIWPPVWVALYHMSCLGIYIYRRCFL